MILKSITRDFSTEPGGGGAAAGGGDAAAKEVQNVGCFQAIHDMQCVMVELEAGHHSLHAKDCDI